MKKLLMVSCSLIILSSCQIDISSSNDNSNEAKDITNLSFNEKSANCEDHVALYKAQAKDIKSEKSYNGNTKITVENGKCIFEADAIPNHDFNDSEGRGFANEISKQDQKYEITTNPKKADKVTQLSLRYDNAIMLNGIKIDLLAAGCYGIGNGKVGCNDMTQPWRYDPMSEDSDFGTDSHHAHTQPDGTYHYHGGAKVLYGDDKEKESPVIGFAADGFPIFGPYVEFDGEIRKVKSSYQLKNGSRPSGVGNPGGNYDGTFIDDFEYNNNSGDLDECNGMEKNGIYGYYVTESYPHVLGCLKGTPDESFKKLGPGRK